MLLQGKCYSWKALWPAQIILGLIGKPQQSIKKLLVDNKLTKNYGQKHKILDLQSQNILESKIPTYKQLQNKLFYFRKTHFNYVNETSSISIYWWRSNGAAIFVSLHNWQRWSFASVWWLGKVTMFCNTFYILYHDIKLKPCFVIYFEAYHIWVTLSTSACHPKLLCACLKQQGEKPRIYR